ncbi:hypothetical protein K435DRAFT_937699 [Dendrothele bispora CBS 962.96]|uniref:Uncharacterized protein n=1 Tax=Dendrothele bispora (strain CBS 962.96) TaxID=1314807 RepID=A0A4S8MBD5_DENBC|nr:hypothetical protein K435DRAFT_937699 [Dendrothele bispora CBS 962.96]
MENFSPTGHDGFRLEDWITVADSNYPSSASTPFDTNTWDTNAIATTAPFEQTNFFNTSLKLSHQRSVLFSDNSLRQALVDSDNFKLENDDTVTRLSGDHYYMRDYVSVWFRGRAAR